MLDGIIPYPYGRSTGILCKVNIFVNMKIKDQMLWLTSMMSQEEKYLDHSYWILIVDKSKWRKANTLLDLINHEPDIDKINYMIMNHMMQNIISL